MNLNRLSKQELINEAKKNKLETSGTRVELIKRILKSTHKEQVSPKKTKKRVKSQKTAENAPESPIKENNVIDAEYIEPGKDDSSTPIGKTNTALAVKESNNLMVSPAMSTVQAMECWKEYLTLAEKIELPDDSVIIKGHKFRKKSFWRKVQRFFNLTLELKKEWWDKELNTWYATYRALAPNGAFMDGDGACSIREKDHVHTQHETRAIAHTRGKNRAISDLCAFGEVSAEEVVGRVWGKEEPVIDSAQRKYLEHLASIIWDKKSHEEMSTFVKQMGYSSSKNIKVRDYNNIKDALEKMKPKIEEPPMPDIIQGLFNDWEDLKGVIPIDKRTAMWAGAFTKHGNLAEEKLGAWIRKQMKLYKKNKEK